MWYTCDVWMYIVFSLCITKTIGGGVRVWISTNSQVLFGGTDGTAVPRTAPSTASAHLCEQENDKSRRQPLSLEACCLNMPCQFWDCPRFSISLFSSWKSAHSSCLSSLGPIVHTSLRPSQYPPSHLHLRRRKSRPWGQNSPSRKKTSGYDDNIVNNYCHYAINPLVPGVQKYKSAI